MFINNFEPVAIQIFSLEIRWYSLAYIFGILFAWIYCKKILIKKLKPKYNVGHDKDARYRKVWVNKKWSKKRIEAYKTYKLKHIDSDCERKQGHFRLIRR